MGTKKLTAIWHILKTTNSLASKMSLLIFLQGWAYGVAQDVEKQATDEGQLHTLLALRQVTISKQKQNGGE